MGSLPISHSHSVTFCACLLLFLTLSFNYIYILSPSPCLCISHLLCLTQSRGENIFPELVILIFRDNSLLFLNPFVPIRYIQNVHFIETVVPLPAVMQSAGGTNKGNK